MWRFVSNTILRNRFFFIGFIVILSILFAYSAFTKLRKTTRGKGRHFLHADEGGGMTEAGRKAYKKENPGSKLSAPVTGKVKPGSKAAKRRKSFCARSRKWKSKRGLAARRRWKC